MVRISLVLSAESNTFDTCFSFDKLSEKISLYCGGFISNIRFLFEPIIMKHWSMCCWLSGPIKHRGHCFSLLPKLWLTGIRSRDPLWYPWLHFFAYFCFHTWDFRSFWLAFRSSLRSRSTARPKLGLFLSVFAGNIEGTVHRSIDLQYFLYFTILSRTPWFAGREGPLHYEIRPYNLLRGCPRV